MVWQINRGSTDADAVCNSLDDAAVVARVRVGEEHDAGGHVGRVRHDRRDAIRSCRDAPRVLGEPAEERVGPVGRRAGVALDEHHTVRRADLEAAVAAVVGAEREHMMARPIPLFIRELISTPGLLLIGGRDFRHDRRDRSKPRANDVVVRREASENAVEDRRLRGLHLAAVLRPDRLVERERLAVVDGIAVAEAPRADVREVLLRGGRPERRDRGRAGERGLDGAPGGADAEPRGRVERIPAPPFAPFATWTLVY